MSMAVTTSRVSCPLCRESATLTVQTAFGPGDESTKAVALMCSNGCQPDESEMVGLFDPVVMRN